MFKRIIPAVLLAFSLVAMAGIALASTGPESGSVATGDLSTTTTTDDDTENDHDDDSPTVTTTTIDGDDFESFDEFRDVTTTTTVDDPKSGTASTEDNTFDDHGYMIEDGVHIVDASPLGSITVEVKDGMLTLTSIDIDPMWTMYKQDIKSDEIELGLSYGDSELKIKVELDEGQLKKMIDIDMDDDVDDHGYMIEDGVHIVDASPLGSITVEVKDGMLTLTSIDIDPMWTMYKQDIKSDEIELGFSYGDSELKIKVELDEGQLKKMIDIDIDD